jgi:MFS transporter, FHS family, L-fucose permease
MAGPVNIKAADTIATAPPADGHDYRKALAVLASLFFIWGFITVINGTLLPHLRNVFDLDYAQTTLIESVWFIAYGVASWPAAKLIERIGYQRSMVTGLIVMAVGALGMIPAARLPSYEVTLFALFVIASGITLLQVAANPYVAVVGPAETSSSRLNLVQAFNSLGTTLAPLFGAYLILGRSQSGTSLGGATSMSVAERLADAQSVQLPYLIVAGVLMVLALVIARFPLPAMGAATSRLAREERRSLSLWSHRNLVFGVPAIFIYLIAEIGVANLFVNFVTQPDIANITAERAGFYLSLLWLGMMVGRFAGAALMQKFRAELILAGFSIFAFLTVMVAVVASGPVAMWALILVGLGHSVMFPTIFTLGIKGLGPLTEEASGLLIMAIAGGALVYFHGELADAVGLQLSFLLTAACELYILFYALWGTRTTHPLPAPKLGG